MSTAPILVTGAAGFVGARFLESAARRGRAVLSVDALAHFVDRPELQGLPVGRKVDRDDLFRFLSDESPELGGIVHLGACTDTTELDEAYLQRVNLDYSKRLWDYARERDLTFVYASSAATYGGGEHGFDDDEARIDLLQPLNPYGWSKQRFDQWALAEEQAGRAPGAWSGFKFFNVYGFGERHKTKMSSVVLQAFDQIRSTGAVRLFESHRDDVPHGHQRRDFVHVDDVVGVLWHALEAPLRRGIYNLGTGRARTFLDLARSTFAALGVPEQIEFVPTPEHLRARYQYFTEAKMDKLRATGSPVPTTGLEEGVAEYVDRLLTHAGVAR